MFKYLFKSIPEGIPVKKGQSFEFASWIKYNDGYRYCYFSD
jgi:hypothetical protein